MPRFHYVKDKESGQSRMVQVQDVELGTVAVGQPNAPTLEAGVAQKRWFCTACSPPKAFAQPGILSMHFAKEHKDLWADKDTWRQFAEQEVTESGDSPESD